LGAALRAFLPHVEVLEVPDAAANHYAEIRADLKKRDQMIAANDLFIVRPDTSIEELCRTLEQHQIRRAPVIDDAGCCCGVVSQADIARAAGRNLAGELVQEVSRPSSAPSRVG
jgi:CBS-domain-containing membrane protein